MTTPLQTINQAIDDHSRALDLPDNLREAIRYALIAPGKRLRPLLAWHACEACGQPGERALPAAIAIEFIHTFSLVHDDLPAMDDDDLRRGRPTLHIHAGEAMAILAGDAMLTLAFAAITDRADNPRLAAALVRELAAGTTAMIAGQVHDTLGGFPPGLDDRARLDLIHRSKTAALIRAACRMGALSADAPPDAVTALTRYGESLGLMFQIIDDLLDVEGTPEQTGKRTNKDAHAGKRTYPALLGAEASRHEAQRLLQEATAALAPLGPPAKPLIDLATKMSTRTH